MHKYNILRLIPEWFGHATNSTTKACPTHTYITADSVFYNVILPYIITMEGNSWYYVRRLEWHLDVNNRPIVVPAPLFYHRRTLWGKTSSVLALQRGPIDVGQLHGIANTGDVFDKYDDNVTDMCARVPLET